MKKISLKNLNLKEVDQLSREQLKNVLGGFMGGTNGGGTEGGTEGGTTECPTGKAKCTIDGDDLGCQTPYMCCRLGLAPDQQSHCDHLAS